MKKRMPEISRFFGITIKMFWDDHNPPHFHAIYAGEEVLINILSLSVLASEELHPAFGI
ncbi:MAG: DUF4160 domain-containing protein [Candidatus Hydrogenedentota bacterium]